MVYLKTKPLKKRRGAYLKCETCLDEFYVFPAYIRKSEKNNTVIRYCSMKCYKKDGENNPFWGKKHREDSLKKMAESPTRSKFGTGELNPNFQRYGEEYGFTGKSKQWWIRKLLTEIGECQECHFKDKKALVIHHKDRNHLNHCAENLTLLCANCHMIEHYKDSSGMYNKLKHGKIRES